MIKWKGYCSKKSASFCTKLWYKEEEFSKSNQSGFSSLTRSSQLKAVDQVFNSGPGECIDKHREVELSLAI